MGTIACHNRGGPHPYGTSPTIVPLAIVPRHNRVAQSLASNSPRCAFGDSASGDSANGTIARHNRWHPKTVQNLTKFDDECEDHMTISPYAYPNLSIAGSYDNHLASPGCFMKLGKPYCLVTRQYLMQEVAGSLWHIESLQSYPTIEIL
ncbi:hypothetical protein L6452_03758 [Arctium lappa]|uniref:Uncharacterized protein n=1 Tax=Arctium lappa TaxID=4217 RepID=A0ACB9FMJ2_ARCLA|nr:hypothetical protein L6452_03758 [Arctium lappa]